MRPPWLACQSDSGVNLSAVLDEDINAVPVVAEYPRTVITFYRSQMRKAFGQTDDAVSGDSERMLKN